MVDISERILAQQRLVSEQRALQRSEQLEQFAYLASHDLKRPLLTIAGFASSLSERYGDRLDQRGRDDVSSISRAAVRMSTLVEDLLDFRRLDDVGQPAPVDCRELVEEVVQDLRARDVAHLEVGALPRVEGFEAPLRVLFQNLIGNALKFARPQTSPRVVVDGREQRDAGGSPTGFWEFAVADDGIGIEPEHRERVFEVFQRLRPEGYEGTGIGLAHCRKAVELHGGRIWVDSEPGAGSVFRFTIAADLGSRPPR